MDEFEAKRDALIAAVRGGGKREAQQNQKTQKTQSTETADFVEEQGGVY
jgi:hypothetical protein